MKDIRTIKKHFHSTVLAFKNQIDNEDSINDMFNLIVNLCDRAVDYRDMLYDIQESFGSTERLSEEIDWVDTIYKSLYVLLTNTHNTVKNALTDIVENEPE